MAKSKKASSGKVGLEVVFKLIGALLCVVAFCLMFADQLSIDLGPLGTANVSFGHAFFGYAESGVQIYNAAPLGFIGFLLVLVGGILVPVLAFIGLKNKNLSMVLTLVGVLVIIVGAILIFCEGSAFSKANSDATISLLFAPILGGIIALLGGLIDLFAPFIAKLLKK